MSRNAQVPRRKPDRRSQRTRDRLGDALLGLMMERPLASITVQDVLDRAAVGRATFYMHYRNKEDLFLSDLDEFLEGMATCLSRQHDPSSRVAPVRELFEHVGGMRPLYTAFATSGKLPAFLDLARDHFARGIAQRLLEIRGSAGLSPEQRGAAAQALAGALLSLMTWWLDRGAREDPRHMDDLFHQIVWSGIGGPSAE